MFLDLPLQLKGVFNVAGVEEKETIQSLWAGYGSIKRYALAGENAPAESVVVKHICLPRQKNRNPHKRGWNTDFSHQRKVKSYQVENNWYKHHVPQVTSTLSNNVLTVPKCYAQFWQGEEGVIVMEDLDASGFSQRLSSVSVDQAKQCIAWLAYFHARFMNVEPEGLWPIGTYWHLATRPDELEALQDNALKKAASEIDKKLSNCKYLTIVHGDAKLANFCFNPNADQVAAVDFQYVGGGCGMKDLVYFIGSCFGESQCAELEQELLNYYFEQLNYALNLYQPRISFAEIESSWRALFNFAWADFYRFIQGWSPGHPKANVYSQAVTLQVLDDLSS